MEQAKHTASFTPGPWKVRRNEDETFKNDYQEIVAGCGYWGDSSQREPGFGISGFLSHADADLIAAAPDLLEAAEAVNLSAVGIGQVIGGDEYTISGDALRKLVAAIAKAIGSAL